MKTKRNLSKNKIVLTFLWTGLLLVLFVTVVEAATTIINTNNGVIDANWANVSMLRDDPDNDTSYPDVEIDKVWIANNSTMDTFYFRADSLIQLPNSELMVAKLDCNRNSSYADAQDVAVVFDPFTGTSFECQGNTYNNTCYHDFPEDDNGVNAAEMISTGGVYTYEWYGSTAGNVNWSGCLGTISVQFAGVLITNYSTEDDTTEPRDYNAPTAVQMKQFNATPGNNWNVYYWVTIVAVLSVGLWLLRRFYHRPG